jgi:hypothetical protein
MDRRRRARRSLPLLQRGWSGLTVVALVAATLASASVARTGSPARPLRYAAYVTSNPQRGGCFARVGIYAGLQVQLRRRLARAALRRLATANKPRDAILTIGSRRYRLALDLRSSAYGNGQIGWSFRPVAVNTRVARHLIGRRGRLRYAIGKTVVSARPVSVADGRCKSLI